MYTTCNYSRNASKTRCRIFLNKSPGEDFWLSFKSACLEFSPPLSRILYIYVYTRIVCTYLAMIFEEANSAQHKHIAT